MPVLRKAGPIALPCQSVSTATYHSHHTTSCFFHPALRAEIAPRNDSNQAGHASNALFAKLGSTARVCPSQYHQLLHLLTPDCSSGSLLYMSTESLSLKFLSPPSSVRLTSSTSLWVYITVVIVNLHVCLIHRCQPFSPDYELCRIAARGWLACYGLFSHSCN